MPPKQSRSREELLDICEDLNQPSLDRFKQALRRRYITFSHDEVAMIVKGSASRQICTPRPRFIGNITSPAPNAKWATDMVVLTNTPSQ